MFDTGPQASSDPRPGATEIGDGRVCFALFAPGKKSVHLIGDFNGWDREADPLQCTEKGMWWIEKQLEPGSHCYQFVVDGALTISDPYARELADDAETQPPRALLQIGREPFPWRHSDWKRPPFNELILYEMHVGDFTPEGTFKAVIDKLDYLKELGINAIELMPIFEFKGDTGWGYDPAFFFAVEKSYGTLDDMRRLVDEAHARGIAIIYDMVLAHTAHIHPFNKLYPYHESPWYGSSMGEQNQFGFPELDYTKEAAQEFACDVQRYWLEELHIDGFRYDYLHGIGSEDEKGVPFLAKAARSIRPDVYLIGEYSPEAPEALQQCELDGAWHVSLSYAVKAMLREGEFQGFHWDDMDRFARALNPWEQGYQRASQMVNYLVSHDEPRETANVIEAGLDEEAAWYKARLGAVILFTMPGEPMLYHGQEWGEIGECKVNERNLIHWERLETERGRQLFDHYKKLCWLRREHPALYAEGYALLALSNDQKSIVFHRWNEEGNEVVVAANFSPWPQAVGVPFPKAGRWLEALSGEVIEAGGDFVWQMEPSQAGVFIWSPPE